MVWKKITNKTTILQLKRKKRLGICMGIIKINKSTEYLIFGWNKKKLYFLNYRIINQMFQILLKIVQMKICRKIIQIWI